MNFSVPVSASDLAVSDTDFRQLSHDLRTPFDYIGGVAELLLMDKRLDALQTEYVRAILSCSQLLQAVVSSFLEGADKAELGTAER